MVLSAITLGIWYSWSLVELQKFQVDATSVEPKA